MARVFVDSTVLLYTLDRGEPAKSAICVAWLRALRHSRAMVLSPQVLNECYSAASRKRTFAGARPGLRDHLKDYFGLVTAPLDGSVLELAWRLQDESRIGFWDALLLASANRAGCSDFLSEDLNDGQRVGAVRIVDPFARAVEDVLGPAAH